MIEIIMTVVVIAAPILALIAVLRVGAMLREEVLQLRSEVAALQSTLFAVRELMPKRRQRKAVQ